MLDAISACQMSMLRDKVQLESISQNIANMSTPGYKTMRVESKAFDEELQANLSNVRKQMQWATENRAAALEQSKRPLDLSLSAEGYFEVQNDQGVFYTRRGDFNLNEQGEIMTVSGAKLLGKNGPLRVEGDDFHIDNAGNLFINNQKVDQIQVARFTDPQQLEYLGQGLYKSQAQAVPTDSNTHVLQGYLEKSNVSSVDEMMHLLKASRHFELSQHIMRTADSLLSAAIQQIGEGNV